MFQVKVVVSGSGEMHDVSVPVATLDAARAVVEMLDWMWQLWVAAPGIELKPGVDWCPALAYYEGCDIIAVGRGEFEGNDFEINEAGQWCEYGEA